MTAVLERMMERSHGGVSVEAVAAAPPPVVTVKDVRKTYRQGQAEVQALRGVSLDVRRAELLAICGPSGSGKTTLLNMIGLIDRPTSGSVALEGRETSGLTAAAL